MNRKFKSIHTPYLPDRDTLAQYIDDIYDNGWLTNHGPLVGKLEERLAEYLQVPYVVAVANGTLALQMAIRLLDLSGEVVTTPLSFVATANALTWEKLKPRFADVRQDTCCMDPDRLESLINSRTSAILPVHLFGQACDTAAIDSVARKHGLPVIYDAAQAFGLKTAGRSVLEWGEISVLSFHATKIFHTVEGGALIIRDQVTYQRALRYRSHGRVEVDLPPGLGINAKLSELHAAVGHCMLDEMERATAHYQKLKHLYRQRLANLPRLTLPQHLPQHDSGQAHADQAHGIYFPVLLDSHDTRQAIEQRLSEQAIGSRRYFDPPLHQLAQFGSSDDCPVANDLAQRILLLPMPARGDAEPIAQQVCETIEAVLSYCPNPVSMNS